MRRSSVSVGVAVAAAAAVVAAAAAIGGGYTAAAAAVVVASMQLGFGALAGSEASAEKQGPLFED